MKKTVFSQLSAVVLLSVMLLVSPSAQAQLLPSQGPFIPIVITGPVTCFVKATCGNPGSITIGGVTIPIAAGVDVGFTDTTIGVLPDGTLGPVQHRSDHFEIVGGPGTCGPGTVRTLMGYLDAQGQLRLQIGGFATRLPVTGARTFNVTGVFTVGAGTITVGGLTFQVAGTIPAIPVGTPARVTGTFNASGQLTGLVVLPATTTLTFCDAALNLRSISVFQTPDVNPGDPAGPFANTIGQIATGVPGNNPQGTTISALFRCSESVDQILFENLLGSTSIPASLFVSPGFNLRPLVWTFKPACFVFRVDQFNWIVGATVTQNP